MNLNPLGASQSSQVQAATDLPRANILGVGVHAINLPLALEVIEAAVAAGRKGYVCVTGVHGVMEAQKDVDLKGILNGSFLTTPDGMPTVWMGRSQGFSQMGRVYGPDLMLEICRLSVQGGHTHFLFGGRPGVAEHLRSELSRRFPGLRVVGTFTPPFRDLNSAEDAELLSAVANCKPDFFWVGLSTPKQERFMARYLNRLDTTLMLGVGAAFDVHTGRILDAPDWVKKAGLQWFHRLCQEPRRLGKRYLIKNPQFICHILLQYAGLKTYPFITSAGHDRLPVRGFPHDGAARTPRLSAVQKLPRSIPGTSEGRESQGQR